MSNNDGSDSVPEETIDPSPIDGEVCADTLAAILRTWGQHAFEIGEIEPEEVRRGFEAWARHVLIGTSPTDPELMATSQKRDWAGLQSAVSDQRQKERGFVLETLADLRHVVWLFIECFTKSIAADERMDDRTRSQLDRLRAATEETDVTTLRREALTSVQLIEGAIEARGGRYSDQISLLSEKLDRVTEALAEAEEEGAIDHLTGAFNRRSLDAHLMRMARMGALLSSPPVAFMIDVDHFKWVNDEYGHQVGDDLLKRIGLRLRSEFRRKSDFVSRYGGDEFVVVLQEAKREDVERLGERALSAIGEIECPTEGEPVRVTASIGGALSRPGESAEKWMRRADEALYQAKHNGRGCVVVEPEPADD